MLKPLELAVPPEVVGLQEWAPSNRRINDFVGVLDTQDPAARLRRLGVEPVWHDREVAFAGAPVWVDQSSGLVISGEVLLDNAPDLRLLLNLPGASIGELLLALFRRCGVDAGRHMLGMFALSVWDSERRRLTLIRDGSGARTLYYAPVERGWYFSARLRTLRRSPVVSGDISLSALRKYLVFSYVPGAETMWSNVTELRPGTALCLPAGELQSFWEPIENLPDPPLPVDEASAKLRSLLVDAVRVRLPDAGPVAIYLSGGVDSSLVTALASRLTAQPIHTFAIHFGSEYPNELRYSQMVADHCQSIHHVLEVSPRQIQTSLEETVSALDDPIGDPLTVPNFLMGLAAAQVSSTVLNGEGGDPCFGGPKNSRMILSELYGSHSSREVAYLQAYEKCYKDLPSLLTPQAQTRLKEGGVSDEELLAPFFDSARMSHFLNKLMHINVRLKGADHILTKVNNLTAANNLIGRSPLFDRRIVEMSFAIPPEYKRFGAQEKMLLKHAVADILPKIIVDRPKSGMRVPVQSWLRQNMQRFARSLLLDRNARIAPYINQALVRDWLTYQGEIAPRQGAKLWQLLTLEVWLRVNT